MRRTCLRPVRRMCCAEELLLSEKAGKQIAMIRRVRNRLDRLAGARNEVALLIFLPWRQAVRHSNRILRQNKHRKVIFGITTVIRHGPLLLGYP